MIGFFLSPQSSPAISVPRGHVLPGRLHIKSLHLKHKWLSCQARLPAMVGIQTQPNTSVFDSLLHLFLSAMLETALDTPLCAFL